MSTCKHCAKPIVWIATNTGSHLPFNATTRHHTEVPAGDGFLLTKGGVSVPATQVSHRVIISVQRLMVVHRCPEYAAWLSRKRYGIADTLANIIKETP